MNYIQQRINELAREREQLEIFHFQLVRTKQADDQKFQQQVGNNQSRFAQIQGAIAELQQLNQKGEYHAVSILDSIIHGGNATAPGDPDRVSGNHSGHSSHSGADLRNRNMDHPGVDPGTDQAGDRAGVDSPGSHLGT